MARQKTQLKPDLEKVMRWGSSIFPHGRRGSKPHPFSAAFPVPVPF
jgi:hypothetical protein